MVRCENKTAQILCVCVCKLVVREIKNTRNSSFYAGREQLIAQKFPLLQYVESFYVVVTHTVIIISFTCLGRRYRDDQFGITYIVFSSALQHFGEM